MAVGTDLRAGTDRGPGVDHGAATDVRADVDVRRHQDCIRRDERALAHGCRWHHARALLGEFPGTPVRELEGRSEEHTSELQSLMPISYAVFCLKKTTTSTKH